MATAPVAPPLSQRGRTLPESPIRRLIPLAAEARAHGVTVHHLNIGQPDLPPHPLVVEALERAAREPLTYAPTRGLPEVIEAWRRYYRGHGVELTATQLLVTAGASEAIALALTATCDRGDEVIVPEPFYAPYKGLAHVADVKLVPVSFGADFAPPSLADIESRITGRTRALLLCSPNNPTGTVYDRDVLAELGELVAARGLFLLADETYREIVFDGGPAESALAIAGLEDNVVAIDSLSKRFNICGLRMGCVATRNIAVMNAMLNMAELRLAVPVVDQRATIGALDAPYPYVQGIVDTFRQRRDVVVEDMSQLPGVVCAQPAGAFYVTAKLPVTDAAEFAAWLLRDFSHHGETVCVTPMSDFYLTPGRGDDEIRLACVMDPAILKRAVDIIAEGLRAYEG